MQRCKLLCVVIVAVSLLAPNICGEESVDDVVPETALVAKVPDGTPFGFQCKINVEHCYTNHDISPTSCQICMDKCRSMEAYNKPLPEILACKKGCEGSCVWVKATKDFSGSYQTLCKDEIAEKSMMNEKKVKKAVEDKAETVAKEKKAKGAFEGMIKCKKKENNGKKEHEMDVKTVMQRVKTAQEKDAKLSKSALEQSQKQHSRLSQTQKNLYAKEMTSKEVVFKNVKEAKDKSEKQIKTLKEAIVKKNKISKTHQEIIYKEWQSHLDVVKSSKALKPDLPPPLPPVPPPPPPPPPEVVQKIPAAPKIPEESCKCSFPFIFNGVEFYKCATDADKGSFCLDSKKKVHTCPPSCKAVWCNKKKQIHKAVQQTLTSSKHLIQQPVPVPVPVPVPQAPVQWVPVPSPTWVPVPSPTSNTVWVPPPKPFVPPPDVWEVRVKNQVQALSIVRARLDEANEAVDKSKVQSAEKQSKCAQKRNEIETKVESKTKSEVNSKKEAKTKPAMEKAAKESRYKENASKSFAYKQEQSNKVMTEQTQKESATKVSHFKLKELKVKDSAKEQKTKNPFITLTKYCEKIQKMKTMFTMTKEHDSKKVKELGEKKMATAASISEENEIKTQEIVSKQCKKTHEVCAKINTTSEAKAKHGTRVALESKTKMEAKCALTMKLQKVEQHNLKTAVCKAAHAQLTQVLKSIALDERATQGTLAEYGVKK